MGEANGKLHTNDKEGCLEIRQTLQHSLIIPIVEQTFKQKAKGKVGTERHFGQIMPQGIDLCSDQELSTASKELGMPLKSLMR